jgi:hypothetical protein
MEVWLYRHVGGGTLGLASTVSHGQRETFWASGAAIFGKHLVLPFCRNSPLVCSSPSSRIPFPTNSSCRQPVLQPIVSRSSQSPEVFSQSPLLLHASAYHNASSLEASRSPISLPAFPKRHPYRNPFRPREQRFRITTLQPPLTRKSGQKSGHTVLAIRTLCLSITA